MSRLFYPNPPQPPFKEKPRLPKRTGLRVGQSETLEVSGLTISPNPERCIWFRALPDLCLGIVSERLERLIPLGLSPSLGYWKPRHVRGFLCSRTVVHRPVAKSAPRCRMQPQRDLARAVAFLLDGVGQTAFRDHALRAVGDHHRRKKAIRARLGQFYQ